MKKIISISTAILIATNVAFSQGIAINNTGSAADSSALLDLSSSSKGTLFTRMTTAERNAIPNPANSLIVFNTDVNCLQVYNKPLAQWENMYCYLGCTSAPPMPGSISGNTAPCGNQAGVAYFISQVAGATSYNWTVPSGATITAGQGTTGIIVTFGSFAGNVSVSASNNCGTSQQQTLAVTVSPVPGAAGAISGPSDVSMGHAGYSYSVAAISGATSYVWAYSGTGVTINGTGNQVTIDFSASAASGNLTVAGLNSCDTGAVSTNFPISAWDLKIGIRAYYNLDETSGNAADATGNGFTLTNNNSVSYSTGKIGNSADFGTTNNNKTLENSAYPVLGMYFDTPFTYNIWMNVSTFVPTGLSHTCIMWTDDATTNKKGYSEIQPIDEPPQKVHIDRRWNSGGDQCAGVQTFTYGTWYMLSYTWDGSTIKIHINGNPVPLTSCSSTSSGSNTANGHGTRFILGGDAYYGRWYDGLLDEVGVWSRPLSTGEISALYNSGSGLTYPF